MKIIAYFVFDMTGNGDFTLHAQVDFKRFQHVKKEKVRDSNVV